jgi:hypothetical protein
MKRTTAQDEAPSGAQRQGEAQYPPERDASESGERIEDWLQRFGLVSGSPSLLQGKREPRPGVRVPVRRQQQNLP